MFTASSASRACGAEASASLYTATEPTPSSLHARTIRSAISPRFAMRTLLNTHLAFGDSENVAHRRALELRAADEGVAQRSRCIDEKGRWVRAVEGIDAQRMPDAVRLHDYAITVAENGEAIRVVELLERDAHAVPRLREHHGDANPRAFELGQRILELGELATAARTPHAAMEDEQQPAMARKQRIEIEGAVGDRIPK